VLRGGAGRTAHRPWRGCGSRPRRLQERDNEPCATGDTAVTASNPNHRHARAHAVTVGPPCRWRRAIRERHRPGSTRDLGCAGPPEAARRCAARNPRADRRVLRVDRPDRRWSRTVCGGAERQDDVSVAPRTPAADTFPCAPSRTALQGGRCHRAMQTLVHLAEAFALVGEIGDNLPALGAVRPRTDSKRSCESANSRASSRVRAWRSASSRDSCPLRRGRRPRPTRPSPVRRLHQVAFKENRRSFEPRPRTGAKASRRVTRP